jgi:Thymidylate synthase
MTLINARNPHEALPRAIGLLQQEGVRRESRNGPVLVMSYPVATVYTHPLERVVLWPQRDANPFFHLYEAIWMLAGRNDVEGVARYAKNMRSYSDDGTTLHGAYGYRWRNWFHRDQIEKICETLRQNPDDRRCVLQMWDANQDLSRDGLDVPCNLVATAQRDDQGKLNLTVFQRSGDILWGVYGANCVHFSYLQEHMANQIGCSVGTYTHICVNFHAYLKTLEQVKDISKGWSSQQMHPYEKFWALENTIRPCQLPRYTAATFNEILRQVDSCVMCMNPDSKIEWDHVFLGMMQAHHQWYTLSAPERYNVSLKILQGLPLDVDWVVAGKEWLTRRKLAWEEKLAAKSF